MARLALHWQILIAIATAVVTGLLVDDAGLFLHRVPVVGALDFLGTFFLNALKMLIVPLIASSIISAMSRLGSGQDFRRLGLKTLGYYFTTSLLAILMGLFWVNILAPGHVSADNPLRQLSGELDPALLASLKQRDASDLVSVFLDLVPPNIIQAAANGQMLGLIVFSLLFGYFITRLTTTLRASQQRFWSGVNEVMLGMTGLVLRLAPVGVFALVAKTVALTGFAALQPLLLFFGTVTLALGLHLCVSLALLLRLAGRVNPWVAFKAMSPALLMAFSTASSSATLPVTLDVVQRRAGVSDRVSSFVLPLGATVNMDGTALYECVAAMFIAQLYGIELGAVTQFTVVLIALLSSVGVAGIPAASLVAITIILSAVGLPMEAIGVLMLTNRLLDMMRTATNVFSDACCSLVIARTEGEETCVAVSANSESG